MGADGENEFIVPPPGMVPPRTPAKPVESELQEPADVIDLPPGIVDSGTYRIAAAKAPHPHRLDDAPAFFPAGVQILPAADAPREPVTSVEAFDAAPPTEPTPVIDTADTAGVSAAREAAPFDAIDEATTVALHPRREPVWHLALPEGEQIAVERTVLIGRDPSANSRWPDAALLSVIDPGKSVSKTHAVIQLAADGQLFAHDLHSTNGVYLRHPESDEMVVEPDHAQTVQVGTELRLGQFVLTVGRD